MHCGIAVSAYVWAYVCMYAGMYSCMCVCMYGWALCMYMYVCVYVRLCACRCVGRLMYVRVPVCMYVLEEDARYAGEMQMQM